MAYGIEIFDASGNKTLGIDDETVFFVKRVTGTIAANQTIKLSEFDLGVSLNGAMRTIIQEPQSHITFDSSWKFAYLRAYVGFNFLGFPELVIQSNDMASDYDIIIISRGTS